MPRRNHTILGINPGTRYFAIAALVGTDLQDWRIKCLAGDFHKHRLPTAQTVLKQYLDAYEPDAIALKLVHPSRTSTHLTQLTASLGRIARARGVRVLRYGILDLKAHFEPRHAINRDRLAELVASRHQILLPELEAEQGNRNRYYSRLFEAVAAADLGFDQIDNQPQSA